VRCRRSEASFCGRAAAEDRHPAFNAAWMDRQSSPVSVRFDGETQGARPPRSIQDAMTNPTTDRQIQGATGRKASSPPLIKLGKSLKEALLLIMAYVGQTTGTEPSQDEIAAVLQSYFTLDEVTNQINYLRKKPAGDERADEGSGLIRLRLRINLMSGPPKNSLARAGFFIRPIAEGIVGLRKHAKAMLGAAPGEDDVARSLKSSFILSEIKNQIVHGRKSIKRPA
jgi:hypothetical protein